jgi:hypothetical protein
MEIKSFNLFLNSSDDTNKTGVNVSDLTYNINWNSIIPAQFYREKLEVKFSFCSEASEKQTESYLLYADFGGVPINTKNQSNNPSNLLGIIPWYNTFTDAATIKTIWEVDKNFNPPVVIPYPQNNNFFNIKLKDQSAPFVQNIENYVLLINFKVLD